MHAAATSKVENSAQGSSCKLKFVHGQAKQIRFSRQNLSRQKIPAKIFPAKNIELFKQVHNLPSNTDFFLL
jgi:hypothetical protein